MAVLGSGMLIILWCTLVLSTSMNLLHLEGYACSFVLFSLGIFCHFFSCRVVWLVWFLGLSGGEGAIWIWHLPSICAWLIAHQFIRSFLVLTAWLCFLIIQRKNNYSNGGKRRMNTRTSMAQRQEIIRRTVYVTDIDRQVKTRILKHPCAIHTFFWEFELVIFSPWCRSRRNNLPLSLTIAGRQKFSPSPTVHISIILYFVD